MTWKDFPNLTRQGRLGFFELAGGGRLRYACWSSEATSRGIIVLINGHREYMEKYSEFISDCLVRGYAVYTVDNRGQGLSDRFLKNRLKSYIENFDIFINDLNEFITKKVMADPRAHEIPVILIGHSMGAHVCLRYLAEYPDKMHKAVLMAPMTDFYITSRLKEVMLKSFIRMAYWLGFGENYGFRQGSVFSKDLYLINQHFLTHDDERYMVEIEILETFPDLYVGGATYSWLKAALDSIAKLHAPQYLNKVTLPLLVLLAGEEKLVSNKATNRLLSRHKNCKIVTIDGARHEIYREKDEYRHKLWQEIESFLTVE